MTLTAAACIAYCRHARVASAGDRGPPERRDRPLAGGGVRVRDHPTKLSTWQDVEEVSQITPGPVGPGTRFREVHKAPGIRRVEITEVVVFEPGRRFDIRLVEGPPIDGRWDFEPAGAGTRLTLTPAARLRGPLRIAEPLVRESGAGER
jgi:hypothetical protein